MERKVVLVALVFVVTLLGISAGEDALEDDDLDRDYVGRDRRGGLFVPGGGGFGGGGGGPQGGGGHGGGGHGGGGGGGEEGEGGGGGGSGEDGSGEGGGRPGRPWRGVRCGRSRCFGKCCGKLLGGTYCCPHRRGNCCTLLDACCPSRSTCLIAPILCLAHSDAGGEDMVAGPAFTPA